MDSKLFVVFAVVLGLLTGLAVSELQKKPQSYCESLEEGVRENKSFEGTVDCFEPGVLPVNISEEIENRTDLRCVCRHSHNGESLLFPVSVSEAESTRDR